MPHEHWGDVSEMEALFDQLEYLLWHRKAGCTVLTCPECARLNNVSVYLLAPFRMKPRPGWKLARKDKQRWKLGSGF